MAVRISQAGAWRRANATFYGAEANGRLGALLASGDINRDTPNDIVMGAPDAHGGAGRLFVYYGRTVQRSAATDLAATPPSRGILGDPAAGGIGSVFVWEVTGEGARDVILGTPTRNGNTGAVALRDLTTPRPGDDDGLAFRSPGHREQFADPCPQHQQHSDHVADLVEQALAQCDAERLDEREHAG